MTDLKELSERLAWEALEKSGNTKTGRSVMREAADVLAALGETHVVVPREPAAWLVGWHRANGEAGLTSYVNEDDARRAAKNLETYSASETMADVQPLYAVTSPDRGGAPSPELPIISD